jgi:hypothetical protein
MEKRQPMASEIPAAKESARSRFLKTGAVDAEETVASPEKPESHQAFKLSGTQDPWGTLTIKLPKPLLNALRINSAKRKAAQLPPFSQQEIVLYLLDKWLKEQGELS